MYIIDIVAVTLSILILIAWVWISIELNKTDELREDSKKTNSEKYAEKLEDPRWKAKRLEILKRDNCTCQWCGSTKNLQVHHHYYVWGREPWEYDDKALITVCRRCHKWRHSTHQNRVYGKYRRY